MTTRKRKRSGKPRRWSGYYSDISGDTLRMVRENLGCDQETFARAMGWNDRFTVMSYEKKDFLPVHIAIAISDLKKVRTAIGKVLVANKKAELAVIKARYKVR